MVAGRPYSTPRSGLCAGAGSLVEQPADGTVAVHVSNHRPSAFTGIVRWQVTNCAGDIYESGTLAAEVLSQTNAAVGHIACQSWREQGGTARLPTSCMPFNIHQAHWIPMAGDQDLLVWAVLEEDGVEMSRNLAFLPSQNIGNYPSHVFNAASRPGQMDWWFCYKVMSVPRGRV